MKRVDLQFAIDRPSAAFVVGRGSAACSNTTAMPHEYFDHKVVLQKIYISAIASAGPEAHNI